MKRKTVFICFLLLFFASKVAVPAEIELRSKIACLPFIARNIEASPFVEGISSMLLDNIAKRGYFEVLERKKIEGLLELEGLKFESLTQEALFRIGNRGGIDFLISGYVSQAGEGMFLEIKLLNLRLQKICSTDKIKMAGEVSRKLQEIAVDIVKKAKECSSGGGPILEPPKPVAPPSEIKITGTAKSIRLRWNHPNPGQVIGYKVFRAHSENGPFTQTATTKEAANADENLKLNETFYYRVKAIDLTGAEGPFSETVVGKTVLAPHPPIFLNLTPDIKSTCLIWRPRPYSGSERELLVNGYNIYRKTAEEKDFKEIAKVGKEATSCKDSGLKDGTTYCYVLTAINADGAESESSSILEVSTITSQVQGRAESGKIRQVPLQWNAQTQETVEGYLIYRSGQKDTRYQKVAKIAGKQSTSYMDRELQDQTTYLYRITAYNKENMETDLSEPFSATTRGKPPVPTGLSTRSGGARKVFLQWNPVNSPEDEVKGYMVYRAPENQGPYQKVTELSLGKNSFTDESPPLQDNATYFYKISSFNSVNAESLYPEAVSATTKAVPKAPAGLQAASREVKKVSLKWEKNPEEDIKEYIIYRKRPEEKDFSKLKSVKQTSYVDAGLKDGTESAYVVQALDQDNLASPLSPPVAASTKPVPQKPVGLKMTETGGKRAISWEANPEKDVKQYSVYKKNFLGLLQKIASVEANTWIIEGLKGKTELVVTAQDEAGLESEGSAPLLIIEQK